MEVYDPLQALVKLRAAVWTDVETLASRLTADQRISSTFVAFDAHVRPGLSMVIQNYYLDHRAEGMSRDQAVRDVERQRDELAKANRVFMLMMHMPNHLLLLFLREQGTKDLVALEAWLDVEPPPNKVKLLLVAGTKMQIFHVPIVREELTRCTSSRGLGRLSHAQLPRSARSAPTVPPGREGPRAGRQRRSIVRRGSSPR